MDDVNSTEDNATVIANDLPEPPTNMSKRQLKKLQREKKWLEHRSEKRLGTPDVMRQRRTKLCKSRRPSHFLSQGV